MAIVLLGLSFLTGASGQVSLGNGAFMGVGAYTVAIWSTHHASTPIVAELALSIVAGAIIGLAVGLPATRLRGPYLAGMTLAFAIAFPAILSIFGSWTGGDSGLALSSTVNAPSWVVSLFSSGTPSSTPTSMWLADIAIVTAGVAFFFMANLFGSRTGRAMRLVRDNDVAAELAGVSLPHARVLAFMVAAAYAGLGGGVTTLVYGAASPSQFDLALSITILALLVIGGIGTLSGALIGGLIFAYSDTWISWIVNQTGLNPTGNLAENLTGMIYGIALMAVMLAAPLGIAGTIRFAIVRGAAKRRDPRPAPAPGAQ
jgi:branched-chain amino acid transport system permease protein